MAVTTITSLEEKIQIERPTSPTPSELSIYFDIDEEVEVSLSSSVEELTPSITRGDLSEIKINCAQTPTRLTLPLPIPFNLLEISPSFSSESSINSSPFGTEPEPYSPITGRSRSSSISSDCFPPSSPTTPISRDPCLQCFLVGLSCSLSESGSKPQAKIICCRRCARNGECFCIFQVPIGKNPEGRYLRRGSGDSGYTYHAEGIQREVVLEKAKELLEAKMATTRFALPKMSVWKRQILRPVFGGWVVNDEGVVEVEVK